MILMFVKVIYQKWRLLHCKLKFVQLRYPVKHKNEMSLDDILSADSEGSKLHLDGFNDDIGQQKKEVSVMDLS